MYNEMLMEHYKYPVNKKKIEYPSFAFVRENFSCGDKMAIQGVVQDGVLIDVGFDAQGCVISQAAASLLTQECLGKKLDEILAISVEDIVKLIGLELGPNRLKCALLSLDALKRGIGIYLGAGESSPESGPVACSVSFGKKNKT